MGTAAACSSSKGNDGATGSAETSNFTGAAWTGTDVFTTICNGATNTQTSSDSVTFVAEGAGVALAGGCTVDFSVSGDTATLSNVPHCVQPYGDAGAEAFLYQGYTFTTTDGHNLTGADNGTLDFNTGANTAETDCTFSDVFTATR